MLNYLIYFLVAFLATTIGGSVGLGGGLIIKPLLELLNDYDHETINVLSTFCILAMSLNSTINLQKKGEQPFAPKVFPLIIGSFVGGVIGSYTLSFLFKNIDTNYVANVQTIFLIGLLIIIVITNLLNYSLKLKENKILLFIFGIIMALVSSFLGIGGGLLNVAILIIIFNYTNKNAAIFSTVTILFTQISSIITTIYVNNGLLKFNLQILIVMIPASILGGLIGSKIIRTFSERSLKKLLLSTLSLLILMNVYILFT